METYKVEVMRIDSLTTVVWLDTPEHTYRLELQDGKLLSSDEYDSMLAEGGQLDE